MRVLVVSNFYPPHHFGGYELSCHDVMQRWSAAGHDVTVVTSDVRVPGVADPAGEAGSVLRELRMYWDDHVLLSPSPLRRMAIERHNRRVIRRALEQVRPDVMSVWNVGAMSLSPLVELQRSGVPIVLNICDDWTVYGPRLDAWLRMFAARPALGRVVAAVTGLPTRLPDVGRLGTACFVSETTRSRAEQASGWHFPDATVVFSGISDEDFPPLPGGATAGREFGWRLLYVGRLDQRKGIDRVVRALPLLPPTARLDIVGRGDARVRTELRELAEQLGVAARVGFSELPREQLRRAYREADALVFPSVWDEPFGLVPVEAMACGTPVVATRRGGSAEFLVPDVNCVAYEAEDEASLAAALHRLAGDPGLRRRVVDGGLLTAEQLRVSALADHLLAWHLAAAERFRNGRPPARGISLPVAGPG